MKPRHVMTALLGALVLSCQGPAAVLAQAAAADTASGDHRGDSPTDPEAFRPAINADLPGGVRT